METADAERRRLERDLHDGAQQRLVGLALGLRLAESRLGLSPELAEAKEELTRAIDDLRALARGLSPVLLAEAGLRAALRGLAESCEVHLVSVPAERLPLVIESTTYALVERAAADGPVGVDIRREGPALVVEITARLGVPDLGGLGDRVTALGGEVSMSGATVRVRLPA